MSIKNYPYYFFLATSLLLHLTVNATEKESPKAKSECINCISIRGSSNINHFRLFNYNPKISPPAEQHYNSILSQHILIPVYDFTGPNTRMLNDFYDMVHASKYPTIKISMELNDPENFCELSEMAEFKTWISIAGVTQLYSIPCQITSYDNSGLIVKGNLQMKLSDFNITPPEKVLGAVKVNNEVFINFAFKMGSEEILTEKITR